MHLGITDFIPIGFGDGCGQYSVKYGNSKNGYADQIVPIIGIPRIGKLQK